MLVSCLCFVGFLAVVSSFKASPRNYIARRPLSVVVDESASGILPPTGFFDPLGLAARVDAGTLKKYRESELKHGRIAMLAALGIPVAEVFHPWDHRILGAAIYHYQEADMLNLLGFFIPPVIMIFLAEINSIDKNWEFNEETRSLRKVAMLKDEYEPGDLGFDPLGLCPRDDYGFKVMRNRELQHGRLAMIGTAGMVAQELIDGKGILDHWGIAPSTLEWGFKPFW